MKGGKIPNEKYTERIFIDEDEQDEMDEDLDDLVENIGRLEEQIPENEYLSFINNPIHRFQFISYSLFNLQNELMAVHYINLNFRTNRNNNVNTFHLFTDTLLYCSSRSPLPTILFSNRFRRYLEANLEQNYNIVSENIPIRIYLPGNGNGNNRIRTFITDFYITINDLDEIRFNINQTNPDDEYIFEIPRFDVKLNFQ